MYVYDSLNDRWMQFCRHYLSVVLSGDRSGRLMKYDPASKQVEVLVSNLAFPNGVALSKDGCSILLAETTSCRILREKLSELLFSYPWTGNVLLKLPFDMITKLQSTLSRYRGGGFAVRLGENGDVLEVFEDDDGNRLKSVSEIMEKDGRLWIGSVNLPFAGRCEI
ncbi:PROTEIN STRICTOSIDINE SYNTHASE-LIKE 2 [Salix viminalis]|uniref:PROTEIN STRICTOSIDINE SYNTHASE-LIKE 2 n=1 Tax=Salix viminalis TaxID=40686 RepID=A0A9Q0ZPC1_SALVM|nr:PROTEIN STRICTOSIDINE SYNTHASE-LIKE 2 [Salix viminalis]